MSVPATASLGSLAVERLLSMLDDAGVEATRDPGSFFPQPIAVLVGLPTLERRTQGGACTFSIPVLVVSGDPFNTPLAVDRALAMADECALALAVDNYRPSSWKSGPNAEPLPAYELTVTVATKWEGT